jgi:hypothetical protein
MRTAFLLIGAIVIIGLLSSPAYSQGRAPGNLLLTGKNVIDEYSNNHVAVAAFDGKVFVAWTGVNDLHNVNIAYSDDGYTFPKKNVITLNESSGAAPCLTVYGGELCLLWSDGGTGKIHVMFSPHTTSQRRYTLERDETRSTISGFPHKEFLAICWKGEDSASRPNVLLSSDGINFDTSRKKVLESDSSRYHPAGASFAGKMVLAFVGVDQEQRINVRHSSNDGNSWQNAPIMDIFSKSGPSLLVHGDRLIMAYAGTDGKINIVHSADGISFSNKTTFFTEETQHSPTLTTFQDKVYMCWLGIDNRINIAKVEGF